VIDRSRLTAEAATAIAKHLQGRKAQRSGAKFEEKIAASVRDYPVVSICELPKCGARFTGKGRSHSLPIACDFIGSVCGPGVGLFFDAKSTEKEYGINLAAEKILKAHQASFLHAQALAGAIAGILVECKAKGDCRWLDGRHLGKDRAYTAWHDPRWLSMGGSVNFGLLVRVYLG
jgi:hypothetical protein